MPNPIQRIFSALAERDFRLLWLGSLSAFVGFFMSTVVQSVVAFELTHENSAVGYVVFGRGLAQVFLGPLGGATADRVSKKAILLVCQSVTTVVFVGLAWLLAADLLTLTYLVVGGFLVGGTFAFLGPTRQAYVVDLVVMERRGNAVALNQVALNASRVMGPALAGAFLAWEVSGASGAFLVMGLLYALALLLQAGLPPSQAPAASGKGVLSDVVAGLRYVRSQARLARLLLFFVLVIMFGFGYVTLLPGFVEHVLHEPADSISVLFLVSALGGLLASLLVAPLADGPQALRVYVGSALAFGLCLVLCASMDTLLGTTLTMFALGLTTGGVTTLNGAVLLRESDPAFLGRVMSIAMLAFGGFGLMGLPVGYLADAFGEAAVLAGMGGAVCAVVLLVGAPLVARSQGSAEPRVGPT